jgi:hypothetical protein
MSDGVVFDVVASDEVAGEVRAALVTAGGVEPLSGRSAGFRFDAGVGGVLDGYLDAVAERLGEVDTMGQVAEAVLAGLRARVLGADRTGAVGWGPR